MNTVSSAAYFTARYQSANNRRSQGGTQRGSRAAFNGRSAGGTGKSNSVYQFVKTLDNDAKKAEQIRSLLGLNPVSIIETDGFIVARTPYNPELVQQCKALHGGYCKALKCWFFAMEQKDQVCAAVQRFFSGGAQRAAAPKAHGTAQPSQTVQTLKSAPGCPSPDLSLAQLMQVSRVMPQGAEFAFTESDGVVFCRVPLNSPFTQTARSCGGVWIKDLRAWALNAAARRIFAPIYNQLKRAAGYYQHT